MDRKKFLKILTISIILITLFPAALVIIFDPFFHYHKPIKPLKAVLTQAEYQVIGTLKNFEYDSLIAGSSMAENYNNRWFDEAFNCTSIKAVKPGANTSDLNYLINEAYKHRNIKNIFYTLDIAAITTTIKEHYVNEGMPLYLYNNNPFDDVKYLFNKHVIFKEIPYMIAHSFIGDYDEGDSFNWAKYKTFDQLHYTPKEEKEENKKIKDYEEYIDFNLNLIENMVISHPETRFIFMVPPYSSLWWYEADMSGDIEYNLYALEKSFDVLTEYDNVEIYYFQDMEEIVSDLGLYMDLVHYHPDINKKLVDLLGNQEYRITKENIKIKIESMRELAGKCINEYAPEYFKNVEQ